MSGQDDWGAVRARFPGTEGGAYLNTAAEGLWPGGYPDAIERYRAAKARGSLGRDVLTAIEYEARCRTASILGVDPAAIAFVASASRGIDAVLGALQLEHGDNIVMPATEFPAAILAGQRARERGIEVRVVVSRGGAIEESAIAAAVDSRTRGIVVSAVSFITGALVDLQALATVVDRSHTRIIVDGTQAAGVVELPLASVDACVASTYKWLLGPHGLGVLYLNPDTMTEHRAPYSGWRGIADLFGADRLSTHRLLDDARRFEEGMPNTLGLAVLAESLRMLDSIGTDAYRARTRELTELLVDGLTGFGIEVGPDSAARRAAIVTMPRADAERTAQRLAERGVHVWGRAGVIRLSPYFYNDEDDVERAVQALVAEWDRGRTG